MSLYDVGETAFITFWTTDDAGLLADADATPVAALTQVDPAGPTTTPAVAHPSTGTYTVACPLPVQAEYSLRVVATTGGSSRVDVRRLAAVPEGSAALPAWAPSLADVADHIPTRTRPTAEWGTAGDPVGTFTAATTPNRDQVARLIRRACAYVTGQIGAPVAATAYGPAGVAAALRAAYWVELGYPERDADLTVYDRLGAEADTATAAALRVNVAAGSTDPAPGGVDDLVVYGFPDPPPWAATPIAWP